MRNDGQQGAIVQLRNVTKRYGSQAAVENMALEFDRGNFITLLGPSGSGKTTTLMMLAGFVTPTSGEILIDGQDVTRVPANRRDLGMVFQNYALFPHMTVFDNIAFPLEMRKVARKNIEEKVNDVLELVQLSGMESRYPRQLSGGQQQRVALARTLVFRPRVLLMDEPLSALDRKLREHMQLEIKHLQQQLGLTVIHVTHDQGEALVMSDQIVVLRDGKVEQMDTPKQIYERPASQFVADFIGETNFLKGHVDVINPRDCVVHTSGGLALCAEFGPLSRENLQLCKGRSVGLSIRPERIQMGAVNGCENVARAQIEELVFLGDRFRYVLRLESGETVIAIKTNRAESSVPATGQTVAISVFPGDIRLLLS